MLFQIILRILLALAPYLPVNHQDTRPVLLVVTGQTICAQCIKDKPTVERIRKTGRVQVVTIEVTDKRNEKILKFLKTKGQMPYYILWNGKREVARTQHVDLMYRAIVKR